MHDSKWSNLPSRTHLARSHLIPNKLLLVKVLFSIHKDLVLQQGQIMTPATRAGEIILGKIGATSHGAPWMGAKKTLYSSLRHTHTLMALSIGVCVHTKTRHMETAQSSSENDQSDQKAISCKIRRAALSPLLHYFFILRSASMALRRPLVPPSCSRDTKKRGERERARLT